VVGDVYNWGPLMAGSVIASLVPVLIYIAAQRWVVSGLTAGATKG
jgi:ABC-type glycerol-3-phosphate transport system permease component